MGGFTAFIPLDNTGLTAMLKFGSLKLMQPEVFGLL